MTCDDCSLANWNRTSSGRLHPNKMGSCGYKWVAPPLPASMYWVGWAPQYPSGGVIMRGEELDRECPYFAKVSS